jgi:magnesium transporter
MKKMGRLMRKRERKAGLPPGTPVYIGDRKADEIRVSLWEYDETRFFEKEIGDVEDVFSCKGTQFVSWINVDGIHDVALIEKLGNFFGWHPLIMEDMVNTEQRPKMEDYGNYIFVSLKMLSYNDSSHEVDVEQVCLILGANYVFSFQEKKGDIFDAVRERIRSGKGRIRKMGPDYLAYALLDTVVDHYFFILEKLGERIEELEDSVVTNPVPTTLQEIHKLKREMIFLRRSVWPLRELISSLERGESSLVKKTTGVYLRDVYDHTIQVIDTVETFRDMISGMHDTYLSSISNRMNEIMKVLTIIATIFIPLTFIAGVYGMNFKFMPELEWRWGYFAVWGVIIVIGVIMIYFFKKKKWL